MPAAPVDGLARQLARATNRITGLVLMLFGGVSLLLISWLLLTRAEADLRTTGAVLQQQINRDITHSTQALAQLADRTLVRNALVDPTGNQAYLRPTLDETLHDDLSLRGLWLTDHAARPLSSSVGMGTPGDMPNAARQLAQRCLQTEQAQTLWVHLGQRWQLIIARPVRFATTNSIEGSLVAAIDWSVLSAPWLQAVPAPFRAELHAGTLSVGASAPPVSGELSLDWALTSPAAQTPLRLTVHITWWQAFATALWVAAAYMVGAVGVLSLVRQRTRQLAERSMRPLQRLQETALQITHAGLETMPRLASLETDRGSAEVRSLATSFDAMLARLHGAQSTLEATVAQRTDALRLRTRAVDASTNGIVVTDSRLRGMPMVFVNEGFLRITGYSREEALGQSCGFLQGDDRQQPALKQLRHALLHGEPSRVVLRNYRKDGSLFINDLAVAPIHDEDSGALTHYVGVITDITEQYRAEQLLRDQYARLDTIFELSPDGFVSFDGNGQVVTVNHAFEDLTGLDRPALLGLDHATFEARIDALVLQRNPPGMAHWLSDADTDSAVLILQGLPQKVVIVSQRLCEAPNVSRVLYLRDITRETEVDRMKSEFLSTAAHELRTPMASIRGFSDLLLMRQFDEARTRDVLQTINRQAIWLTDMINELLDLARIEARKGKDFQLEVVDLRTLIDASVSALMVPGDARQVKRGDEPELLVQVDRSQFQHALSNVLSNAYKYSPQGGEITLQLHSRHTAQGRQAGVSVRDHGIGMSPEHAHRAFERFFRADSSGNIPGTGLGLALVKEIVELHGGQVQLDSALGQGTTVTLWLPQLEHMAAPLPRPAEVMPA